MSNDIEEVKARIGKEKFNEIQAFARKLKAAGKTLEEVRAAIREAYREDLEKQGTSPFMMIVVP